MWHIWFIMGPRQAAYMVIGYRFLIDTRWHLLMLKKQFDVARPYFVNLYGFCVQEMPWTFWTHACSRNCYGENIGSCSWCYFLCKVSREQAFLFFPPITVPYVQVQLEAPSVPQTYVLCDRWILFGRLPVECQAPRRRMMPCLLGKGNWVALLPYHYYLMLQWFTLQYYLDMVAQGFLLWFHDLDYGWLVYPGSPVASRLAT